MRACCRWSFAGQMQTGQPPICIFIIPYLSEKHSFCVWPPLQLAVTHLTLSWHPRQHPPAIEGLPAALPEEQARLFWYIQCPVHVR